ncbi:MAG: hypothetical protein AB1801_13915, partial [Chloroflexota bacterium]
SKLETTEAAIKMQRRMAIRQGVEEAINRMIEDMRRLVDQTNIAQSQMEENQLNNLLGVALETPSVELVKLYIQYQVGRDLGGKNWRYANFGEQLVTELQKLKKEKAESIVNEVHKKMPDLAQPTQAEIDEVWLDLVRQYLGQLKRYVYYCKKVPLSARRSGHDS